MQRRKHNLNCIVEDCGTRAYSSQPVFAFPRCRETGKAWRVALGIHPEAEILPGEGVCSLHFGKKYVAKDEGDPRNMWLLPGAVPGVSSEALAASPSPNHCRMCGASQKTTPGDKVSVLRRDVHMLPVLDICLELNSEINSLLPDGVCEACTSMVRSITRFAKTCWKAQEVLAEQYAPGRGGKVEPWKRVSYCPPEPPANDSLHVAEETLEIKSAVPEESSDNEMIELIPMQEVKQEPEPEINEPESVQNSTIEPEETPQLQPEPCNPPKPSNSKARKKAAEPTGTPPPAKRSHPSDGSSMSTGDMYGCDFCAQKFAIKKHLNQHIRTHVRNLAELERKRQLQISQFRCLRCRAEFPTADQLKAHAAQHQSKIECRECNLIFNFDILLDRHNVQMHPERVQKRNAKHHNPSNGAGTGT